MPDITTNLISISIALRQAQCDKSELQLEYTQLFIHH